jgi:RNA polymerase sigma factor (sigma-70 family)
MTHELKLAPTSHEIETSVMMPLDRQEWVNQLKVWDNRAWEILLHHHARDLRRDITISLRKRQLSTDWVDDIQQETWMTVVKEIDKFDWQGEGKFYNWLRSIARHHIQTLNHKVKHNAISFDEIDDNEVEKGLSLDLFMYVHGLVEDSPENEVAMRESMAALDTALQRLKPREREIVMRRLIWRETPKQMAADYGVKPESISMILARAKDTIQVHMAAMSFHKNRSKT